MIGRPYLPVHLPQAVDIPAPERRSVCGKPFGDIIAVHTWISTRMATNVLPLLVHGCSAACLDRLPEAAMGYVCGKHTGGLVLAQPEPK
jgi:hypothetical protein